MKKALSFILAFAVIASLAGLWTWRYITLNRYYDDLDNGSYQLYQMGELVPFEDDGNDLYTDLNGYFVRVDGYEICDYDKYLEDGDFAITQDKNGSDKLVLVYITLINENCEPNPVSLLDLHLRGVDTPLNMDWDLLPMANSALGGYTALALAPGTEQQLVLPYGLRKSDFEGSTWRNLEEYSLYLQVTSNPTTKEVLLSK